MERREESMKSKMVLRIKQRREKEVKSKRKYLEKDIVKYRKRTNHNHMNHNLKHKLENLLYINHLLIERIRLTKCEF